MLNFILLNYLNDFLKLLPYKQLQKRKHDQRQYLEQKRRIVNEEERRSASASVVESLLQNDKFIAARRVLIYYPMRHEISLLGLLDAAPDKEYFLPKVHRSSIEVLPYKKGDLLKRGKFGVKEPQSATFRGDLDLIIVPGVGFDKNNYRIGRGGGYYDRFLKRYSKVPSIGVGYSFQLVDEVIRSKHDQRLSEVIVG